MDRDTTTMMVARNIAALMQARRLDAAKLARAADLNPTGIYDILSGKSRSPKIETIAKVAKALGVPLSSIFTELSEESLVSEMMFVFESLPDQDRQRLLSTGRAWMTDAKE